jgi:predicted Zn-dependent protease
MLIRHCLNNDAVGAGALATKYAALFPTNNLLALLRAKCLLLVGDPEEAVALLSSLHVLPAEGTTEAQSLFRAAHLLLAVDYIRVRAFDKALPLVDTARQWPERLGAGKPYPADVDERIEDWVTYQCQLGRKAPAEARRALDRILATPARQKAQGIGDLIRALALKQSGRAAEAEQLLKDWQAQDPGSDLAKWGAEILAGRPAPLPASLQDLNCRVLAEIARAGSIPTR